MADGFEAQIAALRKLAKLPEDVAAAIRDQLEIELKRTANAGQSPEGTAWPKNEDGSKSLAKAANELVVTVVGTTVLARVSCPYNLHHLGVARGRRVREILPTGDTLPIPVAKAVERVLRARI